MTGRRFQLKTLLKLGLSDEGLDLLCAQGFAKRVRKNPYTNKTYKPKQIRVVLRDVNSVPKPEELELMVQAARAAARLRTEEDHTTYSYRVVTLDAQGKETLVPTDYVTIDWSAERP